MQPILRKVTTAAAATILAASGMTALATPASAAAASKCTAEQHKEIDTVLSSDNLHVWIKLCVSRDSSNRYKAEAHIRWSGRNAVEKFALTVNLERHDKVYKSVTHNYQQQFYFSGKSGRSSTATYTSNTTGGWTADGVVNYDIDADGKGGMTWNLGGSGSI
ncbi:hypothetical protein [Streptomyces sp. enrichment culture]|uniref:hypothetical protein n=1 Tax=Streptomyces sp. enrichment culture TaxID=1795815 RepID=UPI003F555EF4